MKTASKYFLLFVLTALCTVIFPLAASARINIVWHAERVYLYQGRVEIVGYFENTGNETGYVTRREFDLFITAADTGKILWKNYGTQYYINSLRVPAGRRVSYTINIRNAHIPGYKGRFHWETKNGHTYWNRNAG
jgi:hypothetical protein